jgi:hypothetical protein
MFRHLRLVMLFDESCRHESHHRGVVGENPDDVRASLDLGVHAL